MNEINPFKDLNPTPRKQAYGQTLLGGELEPKQKKQMDGELADWDRFQTLLELLCESYVAGEIETDKLCLWAVTIAKEFEGDHLPSIPTRSRDRLIATMMMRAISERPPIVKKPKAYPGIFQTITFELVNKAAEDGYRKSRGYDNSAYLKVSQLFDKLGLKLTERQVEKYYQEADKPK